MPNDATEAALGLLGLTAAFSNSVPPPLLSSSPTVPAKRKQSASSSANDNASTASDTITCICGLSYDDGFSIACDSCGRWCHAACFQIDEQKVPDEWLCWECDPRPVDRERAAKIQRARRTATASAHANKRRASPGVERRARKPSGVAADTGHGHTTKRKRRASITAAAHAQHPHLGEDEHVDIDEPWQQSYVPITKDIVKSDDARDRLRRVAADWRGVTAISPSPSLTPGGSTPVLLTPDGLPLHPPISLQPLPNTSSYPSLFAPGNASVRPPSYAIHATQPIPHSKFIAPYPSTVISTAAYLSDPLNAYAHLGMPKPFVHLIGPPLDLALDARFTGDQSRFVRSGCRPNAVIRPVLCHSKKPSSTEEESLSFGIFALRDLKPNEEIVLGWEWDDGNVVHHLPALIDSPFSFPPHEIQHFRRQMTLMLHALSSTFTTCACGAKARDCALARMAEFVDNQTPLTPSPSPPSQFTKEKNVARSSKTADDGASATPVDLGPLVGIERGFRTRERIPSSGGMGGVEMVYPQTPEVEAGPSRVHAEPSSAGGRRVSFPDDLLSPPVKARRAKGRDRKGKARADDEETTEESDGDLGRAKARTRTHRRASPEPEQDAMDVDDDRSPPEDMLPPKLRKTWIRESAVRLEQNRRRLSESKDHPEECGDTGGHKPGGAEQSFDSREMPPPPVPPARTPPLSSVPTNHPRPHPHPHPPPVLPLSSTASASKPPRPAPDAQASPSTPFSKLSLLSPVVRAPSSTPSPSSRSHPLPPLQTESASPSQSAVPLPKPAQPRKCKPPASAPAEGKEAKKPKARARKDKDKEKAKARDKANDSDTSTAPRTPSTPVRELEEPAALQPSLVRKQSAAKRRKSTAAASQSPHVVVKELTPSVKGTPSSSGFPSPATAATVLPPPTPVGEVAAEPDSARSEPPAGESETPPFAVPAPSSEVVKLEAVQEDVQMCDAPAPVPAPTPLPIVVVEDVQMTDEQRPRSPTPSPQDPVVSEPRPEHPAHVTASPVVASPALPSSAPLASPHRPPSTAAEETLEPPPAESMPGPVSEAGAPEPQRAKSPSPPPPPPKVKLSLRDFAMRKKKQREEQQEKDKLATPSPLVAAPALPADATMNDAHEPESARDEAREVDGQEDVQGLALEVHGVEDAQMVEEKQEEQPPEREEPHIMVVDAHVVASPSAEAERSPARPPMAVPVQPELSPPAPAVECVVLDTPSLPADLVVESSKLDRLEETASSPRHPSPCAEPIIEPAVRDDFSQEQDRDMEDSFRTKVELLDEHVSNGLDRSIRERQPSSSYTPSPREASPASPYRDRFSEPATRRTSVSSYRRDSRTPPPLTSPKLRPIAPQPSQEDGEIFSPPPPKAPPLAPRSHTPPTQPRSFYAGGGSPPSSRRSSPPPPRRPLHPASYRNTGSARPLPSAPRALRAPGGYLYAGSGGGQNAPYYAPRGPSADRDRERERDRERDRDRDRERDRDRDRDRDRPPRDWGRERGDGERDRSWIPGPSRGRGRGWGR